MIIAIDFDGTIVNSDYPKILSPKIGAKEVIRKLHENGHYIILWTCRYGNDLTSAINWMLRNKVPFDCVNDHCPKNLEEFGGNSGMKIYADFYVDDKIIGGFPGWDFVKAEFLRLGVLPREQCFER